MEWRPVPVCLAVGSRSCFTVNIEIKWMKMSLLKKYLEQCSFQTFSSCFWLCVCCTTQTWEGIEVTVSYQLYTGTTPNKLSIYFVISFHVLSVRIHGWWTTRVRMNHLRNKKAVVPLQEVLVPWLIPGPASSPPRPSALLYSSWLLRTDCLLFLGEIRWMPTNRFSVLFTEPLVQN